MYLSINYEVVKIYYTLLIYHNIVVVLRILNYYKRLFIHIGFIKLLLLVTSPPTQPCVA